MGAVAVCAVALVGVVGCGPDESQEPGVSEQASCSVTTRARGPCEDSEPSTRDRGVQIQALNRGALDAVVAQVRAELSRASGGTSNSLCLQNSVGDRAKFFVTSTIRWADWVDRSNASDVGHAAILGGLRRARESGIPVALLLEVHTWPGAAAVPTPAGLQTIEAAFGGDRIRLGACCASEPRPRSVMSAMIGSRMLRLRGTGSSLRPGKPLWRRSCATKPV